MCNKGKKLVFDTLSGKKTDRTPWVPYTGIQIGSLNGISAEKVLKNADVLYDCLMTAHKSYNPDGMPVVFDLQIEAEILGCELMWAEKAPPSVKSHPLELNKEMELILPQKTDGRIPLILDVIQRMKQSVGDTTALYGLICGPLTLASHLRGMSIFMDMFEDPEYVQKLIDFSADVFKQVSDFYIEAGVDIIGSVDPIVSQISPEMFTQFLSKPYKEIFRYTKAKNTYNSFFVCGDATKNLEEMCKTKPDCISIDENIDIVEAKKLTDRYNVVISGNIPLTTVMLLGNQKDNMKFAIDLIDKLGNKNFILAPGCDMPYDVPQENIVGISQVVHDLESTRHFIEHYHSEKVDIKVDMPDYANLDKPFIEVFTIDSATCAACGYMVLAATEQKNEFGDKIDVIERKIDNLENIGRLQNIGLQNLPAMVINGEPRFVSIIPTKKDLAKVIDDCLSK